MKSILNKLKIKLFGSVLKPLQRPKQKVVNKEQVLEDFHKKITDKVDKMVSMNDYD